MLLWLNIPYVFPPFTPCFSPLHIPVPIHSCLVTFPIHLSLVFFHTYIRLVNHVCFSSSYIDYYCQSPTCVRLKSRASRYFLASRNYSTLDPLLFICARAWKLFLPHLSTLQLPYSTLGVHIPAYKLKYLDHNRRPAQHMSWSPCPEPPHIQKLQDPTYMSGSIEAWLVTYIGYSYHRCGCSL